MLNGDPFEPYCEQLIEERDACEHALFRFNNSAMNPSMDVSREERYRQFRAILEPPKSAKQPSGRAFNNPRGSLGTKVYVEPQFTCTYGYNINIGDNVVIGKHCTIDDSRDVNIQANCTVEANVTISTLIGRRNKKGSQGSFLAKPVTIGHETVIGFGSKIHPGVKIGSNCIIEPGSVLKQVGKPRDDEYNRSR